MYTFIQIKLISLMHGAVKFRLCERPFSSTVCFNSTGTHQICYNMNVTVLKLKEL